MCPTIGGFDGLLQVLNTLYPVLPPDWFSTRSPTRADHFPLSAGIEVKEVGLCNWGQWFCAHAPMLAISIVNKKNDTKCFMILYYYRSTKLYLNCLYDTQHSFCCNYLTLFMNILCLYRSVMMGYCVVISL